MEPGKEYVAYYRVSTKKQDAEMATQRTAVKNLLRTLYDPNMKEFKEVESGSKDDRPELNKAITYCKQTGAVLLVAKLDRLSRSLPLIAALNKSADLEFKCCDMPSADRFTINIMGAVAERERELISERTKAAMNEKKAQGVKMGWDCPEVRAGFKKYYKTVLQPKALANARARDKERAAYLESKRRARLLATKKRRLLNDDDYCAARKQHDHKILPSIVVLRKQNLSYARIARVLNESGIPSRWGCLWSPQQIHAIAKRNGLTSPA